MKIPELIEKCSSGVAEIALETNRQSIANGTAFLVDGGLITNSHVIRPPGDFDAFRIRFPETDNVVRLLPDNFYSRVRIESREEDLDYAFIEIDEPEFSDRHRFGLGSADDAAVGEEVIFLGFPFGMPQLTAHAGRISSIHNQGQRKVIQIDGSVNGGNSGGPLLNLRSGKVIGIITRAVTGIIEQEFNELINTLRKNQEVLSQSRAVMKIGGIDPIQGLRASMVAMEQIARNLKRSANVGIGYAFSIDLLKDEINGL